MVENQQTKHTEKGMGKKRREEEGNWTSKQFTFASRTRVSHWQTHKCLLCVCYGFHVFALSSSYASFSFIFVFFFFGNT